MINPFWVIIDLKKARVVNQNKKFNKIIYDGFLSKKNFYGAAAILKKLNDGLIEVYRDQFGIHQVFYSFQKNNIHISTTIDGLKKSGVKLDFCIKKNITFVTSHYRYFVHPSNSSYYQNVFSLMPGQKLIIRKNSFNLKKYINIKVNRKVKKSFEQLGKEYLKIIEDSIIEKLELKKKSIFALSSGMDSSTLVSIAKKLIGNPKVFTTVFEERTDHDESTDVMKTSKSLGLKLYKIPIKERRVFDELEDFSHDADEPCATITQLMHKMVSAKIKKLGFNLIFSGLGGDEAHSGEIEEYLYYFADLKYLKMSKKLSEDMVGWKKYHSTKIYPKNKKTLDSFFKKEIDFKQQGKVLLNIDRFYSYIHVLNNEIDVSKINEPILRNPYKSYLLNKIYQDLFHETIPIVLNAETSNARNTKVSNVYPYLNHDVMNFSFSLPIEYRYKNGVTKHFLREITKNIVPDSSRKNYFKKGWNAPTDKWFKNTFKDKVLDMINSQDVRNRGIYDLKAIKNILSQHIKNKQNHMMFLWQFLSYETWRYNKKN